MTVIGNRREGWAMVGFSSASVYHTAVRRGSFCPCDLSIAKEVASLYMAIGAPAVPLFGIFLPVADELRLSVGGARDSVGALARVSFGGEPVVAVDAASLAVETTPVGTLAR